MGLKLLFFSALSNIFSFRIMKKHLILTWVTFPDTCRKSYWMILLTFLKDFSNTYTYILNWRGSSDDVWWVNPLMPVTFWKKWIFKSLDQKISQESISVALKKVALTLNSMNNNKTVFLLKTGGRDISPWMLNPNRLCRQQSAHRPQVTSY